MLHHDAHHAAYVAKLNAQTAGKSGASLLSLQADAKSAGLNNSAGGHYNHSMFEASFSFDSRVNNPAEPRSDQEFSLNNFRDFDETDPEIAMKTAEHLQNLCWIF